MNITPYFGIITVENISDLITDMSTFRKVDNKYVAIFINGDFSDRRDRVLTVSIEVDIDNNLRISIKSNSSTCEEWVFSYDMVLSDENINANVVIKDIIDMFKNYNGILPSKEYIINQLNYKNIYLRMMYLKD